MADGRRSAALETKLKDVRPGHSRIPGQRQQSTRCSRWRVTPRRRMLLEVTRPDLGQVLVAGAALLAAFVLPPPLRALVTLINVAGVMTRGGGPIANRGLSIEALDAIAITLPTLRGEWRTVPPISPAPRRTSCFSRIGSTDSPCCGALRRRRWP